MIDDEIKLVKLAMRGILIENNSVTYTKKMHGEEIIDTDRIDYDVEKHFPHHLTNTPLNKISTEDLRCICGIYL